MKFGPAPSLLDATVSIRSFDDSYRLQVLAGLQLLDSAPEPAFDALVSVARHIFDCPIALISLVDRDRQWFKARCGLAATQTPRSMALCDHAIREVDGMIVPDATADSRFADNPLVTGALGLRFYAGMPLWVSGADGDPLAAIGALCVLDTRPRTPTPVQMAVLRELATAAASLIQSRRSVTDAIDHARERHDAVRVLARERRLFEQAERMAEIGSWRLGLADQNLVWSDHVYAIHGLPLEKKPALEDALNFYPPSDRAQISAALARTIETGRSYDLETNFITAQGAWRRVRSMGELEVVDGQPVALFGVFQDVTARFELEQALRRSASIDALTGIANRASFDETLDARILSAQASGESLTLMLIDLDGFKQVNDSQGHMAGDAVLQAVATRLQGSAYAGSFVARLGGDEFVLILPDAADSAGLEGWARRVLSDLRQPVVTAECNATISGSIGIARLNPVEDSRREMMRRADMALYAAKQSQRGSARIHGISQAILPDDGPLEHCEALRRAG